MRHFTDEQIKELSTIFGITPIEQTFKVRDGVVSINDKVWWHCVSGPELVDIDDSHIHNIKRYPEYYSIKKPTFIGEYRYD